MSDIDPNLWVSLARQYLGGVNMPVEGQEGYMPVARSQQLSWERAIWSATGYVVISSPVLPTASRRHVTVSLEGARDYHAVVANFGDDHADDWMWMVQGAATDSIHLIVTNLTRVSGVFNDQLRFLLIDTRIGAAL
ncbi:MAG: hypothetical protein WC683_06210 [bacterium]